MARTAAAAAERTVNMVLPVAMGEQARTAARGGFGTPSPGQSKNQKNFRSLR